MPELPEVETVRRGIEHKVMGRVITSVEVTRARSVRRVGAEAVIGGLTGATITQVARRGKYLICELDTDDQMMIHLRMSGRVLIAPTGTDRPAHTHVVLGLEPIDGQGSEMWFVDPRTFGEVVVYDRSLVDQVVPELARLGPDPIVDEFDGAVLARRLQGRRGTIKSVLLDQTVVAGIGNIYADEVLHRCRLRWSRRVDGLSRRKIDQLATTIVEVLQAAIDAGGSTLDDTQYVDIEGNTGSFQSSHLVYGREGLMCLTCGKTPIRRQRVAGRSTSFCPRCQR